MKNSLFTFLHLTFEEQQQKCLDNKDAVTGLPDGLF
jgi:hypothetical protein